MVNTNRGVTSYMDPYEQQFVSSRARGLPAPSKTSKPKTEDELAESISERILSDPKITGQFSGFGDQLANALASLMGGQESSADKLAREKFEFEKAKYLAGSGTSSSDALARRKYEDELSKEKRQIEAYQKMLSGGGYRTGADRMLGLINAQGDTSKDNIEQAYRDALANILGGFTAAEDLTGKGYSALENYLKQNPNNPYAGVQVSAGQAPDAMEQILSAYGVSADPVRAQVAAEQAAAEQGAAGFQNLLNTLGASAQQSDASRLAEMMMAQNLAQTTLGQQRFGYQSQAAQAQAQALAELQNRLAQARLEQESNAESRRQRIEDAIADEGGDVPQGSGDDDEQGDDKQDGAQATPQKPVDALKARAATANPDLKKKINQFVKANPNAGIKKIEKAFPKIAAKIK
jgi:hypothetical protein